jgi:hypothetical protein
MTSPRLVPVAPTEGEPVVVDRSPFWIGSGAGAALRVSVRGIAERHVSITIRDDAFYLSSFPGIAPPRVNGRPARSPVKLVDGQVIELMARAKWQFVTSVPAVAVRPTPPPPVPPPASPIGSGPVAAPPIPSPSEGSRRWLWWIAGAAIAIALAIAGVLGYRAIRSADDIVRFTPQEGQLYDSLLVESTRSMERGSTLLDLGLREAALQEFANAVAVFETSIIGNSRYVRPTIDGLVSAIQKIYRHDGLAAPGRFAKGGRAVDLSKSLAVQLTTTQFKSTVDRVRADFRRRFGHDIEITGADHPEHLSLYGPGGALDIRVRNLKEPEIQFLIVGFSTSGVRVKDFSKDAVLQAQIKAAMAAGLFDRAGTGLHLHIDRFRDRSDRWTVS